MDDEGFVQMYTVPTRNLDGKYRIFVAVWAINKVLCGPLIRYYVGHILILIVLQNFKIRVAYLTWCY